MRQTGQINYEQAVGRAVCCHIGIGFPTVLCNVEELIDFNVAPGSALSIYEADFSRIYCVRDVKYRGAEVESYNGVFAARIQIDKSPDVVPTTWL